MIIVYQGADKTIGLQMLDVSLSASGKKTYVPIDLSDYDGIIIEFFPKSETNSSSIPVVFAKYSLNAMTGYDTLTITDAANGEFEINMDKADTPDYPLGIFYGEIKTSEANADFTTSQFEGVSVFEVGIVKSSVTNGTNPAI